MASLTINVPDEFLNELTNIAEMLKLNPEQCALLALSHFFQTDTLENAIEGMSRIDDEADLVNFPDLKDDLGIEIVFHPQAVEELKAIEEEDQLEVLGELMNRISAEPEELENTLDLVLKEEGNNQIVLSGFSFGDVVYKAGDNVTIYHIALSDEEMDEEDEDDEDDDEDFEDENDIFAQETEEEDEY